MKTSQLNIASPCTVDWRAMTPADGGRFCGDCKKVVRDLSKITETEARAVMQASSTEDLCIRYLYDRDGNVHFADRAPTNFVRPSLLNRAKRAVATAAAFALPFAAQACSASNQPLPSDDPNSPEHLRSMMGGVAAMPPEVTLPSFQDGGDADAQHADAGGDASENADATDTDADTDAGSTPDAGADADASPSKT